MNSYSGASGAINVNDKENATHLNNNANDSDGAKLEKAVDNNVSSAVNSVASNAIKEDGKLDDMR